ncbi:hypothetical protein ACFOPQ_15785 [Deinococcus antarcticus]|uniref:Uncharacterized protein n=1 Tax=Deinococcus antarcticus TaxID=1298767 RepID=A0ABV8ADG0_9DEIO
MDDLARDLAAEARKLHLNAANLADCPETAVRAFAQAVLDELAVRSLLEGPSQVGCWAAPRTTGN